MREGDLVGEDGVDLVPKLYDEEEHVQKADGQGVSDPIAFRTEFEVEPEAIMKR